MSGLSVGRSVCVSLSVIISFKGEKFPFPAPIGTLVYGYLTAVVFVEVLLAARLHGRVIVRVFLGAVVGAVVGVAG